MLLDTYATQFYIDPYQNPIRVAARAAFAQGQSRINHVRNIIARNCESARPISVFDGAISSLRYNANNAKSEEITRERKKRRLAVRKARRRTELEEFDSGEE